MTEEKQTKGGNIRRDDVFGRPLKNQTYELLVSTTELIKTHSKDYKLTAGELLEVMFEKANWDEIEPAAKALRARKEKARAEALKRKRAAEVAVPPSLAKQLKDLTPEKLAAIQAILNK